MHGTLEHTDERRDIADRVRDRRMAAGLSVPEAARAAGINPTTLYRIEAAEGRPQMGTLRALSRVLGTSPAYLLGRAA